MKLFSKKGFPFKICQLTDTHLGAYPFSKEDDKTFLSIKKVLKNNNFDLIMITGDLIWGNKVFDLKNTLYHFYEIFDDISVPVAITYGNHDSEGKFSRNRIRECESRIKYLADKKNLFLTDNRENYTLEVFDDNNELEHIIYVWDSGSYPKNKKIGTYDAIGTEQINWFLNLPYDNYVDRNDIGFLHIPLPEYAEAKIIKGQYKDRVSSSEINSGLFFNLLKDKNFKALFAGHDHKNNFEGVFKGIELVYGNISGYNTDDIM
ncbi:metallophosphoesterase, partial [Oenococcus oeni]|uniref:metallophosphoesterase n=1 Tax=Oenococcus oeni TaxID=1247 RepID=UPI00164671A4